MKAIAYVHVSFVHLPFYELNSSEYRVVRYKYNNGFQLSHFNEPLSKKGTT